MRPSQYAGTAGAQGGTMAGDYAFVMALLRATPEAAMATALAFEERPAIARRLRQEALATLRLGDGCAIYCMGGVKGPSLARS
jgi:hypothetical protein